MFATLLGIEIHVEANKILLHTFKKEYKISCHYDLLFFKLVYILLWLFFSVVNKSFILNVMSLVVLIVFLIWFPTVA